MSRAQLLAAELTTAAIRHRLQDGYLHRTSFRAVYIAGHTALAPLAREMAAVLACDGYGVLSHHSAARVWGLIERGSGLHVTTIAGHKRSGRGATFHRVRSLDRRDIRIRDGVPVTSPARTLLDLAVDATGDELEAAIDEGRARRLLTLSELRSAIGRAPNRAGASRLRSAIDGPDRGFTRSRAERLLRSHLRAAQLPQPQSNARVCGFEVDFLWPDQILIAPGYRVIRITWRQLTREPLAVIARIAQALASSAAA